MNQNVITSCSAQSICDCDQYYQSPVILYGTGSMPVCVSVCARDPERTAKSNITWSSQTNSEADFTVHRVHKKHSLKVDIVRNVLEHHMTSNILPRVLLMHHRQLANFSCLQISKQTEKVSLTEQLKAY